MRSLGFTDTFFETPLETAYGDKLTFNARVTDLVKILAVSSQLHTPLMLAPAVAFCCGTKLHISEWPFIVASLRYTCALRMVSDEHLEVA